MKHLKLFENFGRKEIIDTVNDILSDISDDGIRFSINTNSPLTLGMAIAKIVGKEYIPILWKDVSNSVIHLTKYLDENGYKLSNITPYNEAGFLMGMSSLVIDIPSDLNDVDPDMEMTSLIIVYSKKDGRIATSQNEFFSLFHKDSEEDKITKDLIKRMEKAKDKNPYDINKETIKAEVSLRDEDGEDILDSTDDTISHYKYVIPFDDVLVEVEWKYMWYKQGRPDSWKNSDHIYTITIDGDLLECDKRYSKQLYTIVDKIYTKSEKEKEKRRLKEEKEIEQKKKEEQERLKKIEDERLRKERLERIKKNINPEADRL